MSYTDQSLRQRHSVTKHCMGGMHRGHAEGTCRGDMQRGHAEGTGAQVFSCRPTPMVLEMTEARLGTKTFH